MPLQHGQRLADPPLARKFRNERRAHILLSMPHQGPRYLPGNTLETLCGKVLNCHGSEEMAYNPQTVCEACRTIERNLREYWKDLDARRAAERNQAAPLPTAAPQEMALSGKAGGR